tara:strand:+ start:5541 stop:5990 length:450 start_codon:yes stop_codon:yes gene_type:complete
MRNFGWASLILRIISGTGFIIHGVAKLSRGTGGFEKLLTQLDVPFAQIMSNIVPYVELLGGICILIGLFTRIISLPLIVVMLTAMFTIHIQYGFSSINTIGLNENGPVFGPPGYEVNLLYIAILTTLIILGSGKLSIDEIIKGKKKKLQ